MAIKISPNHNLTKDVPPTILFYGTKDWIVLDGVDFIEKSKKLGNIAELYTAEGQWHWFSSKSPWLERTIYLMDKFLARYGYTQGEPTIKLPEGKVEMKKMSGINLYAYAEDRWGHTPLHRAARHGHKESVELLIANGADVNVKDKWGRTPLHFAAAHGHKELVELLIANGADVNAKESEVGHTPLFFAGLNDVAEMLIARGADVNAKDKRGDTPLHRAAYHGYKERIELLIAKRADLHAKDNNGQTPLHKAARDSDDGVTELLLANGADVNAKDNQGRTPLRLAKDKQDRTELQWATLRRHNRVLELLCKHGAKE